MKTRSFINQSTAVCITLALIGAGAILASIGIPKDPDGGLGARVFPLMASGSLLLLGVIGLITDQTADAERANEVRRGHKKTLVQVFLLLALSLFYVWIIGKLGYLISTALVAPLVLMSFGIRNPFGLLIAAIVCPAIYHALFFIGLGVFPPFGEWFDLLDVIRK